MPSTMPLRVGDELLASARLAADASGRSTAQQIGYWAKLGRELERSGHVSAREIGEVLAGARAYDDVDPKAQAAIRAEWAERIEARRAALDLAEVFTAEGRSWVESGPDGTTVRHPADGESKPAAGAKARSKQAAAKSKPARGATRAKAR
jgi:hypothetical protein